jgi:hypothetical protein
MPSEASVRRLVGTFGDPITCKAYLDAGPEDAKELNLMFWDELCESNQYPNLHRHLSVILVVSKKQGSGEACLEAIQLTGKDHL